MTITRAVAEPRDLLTELFPATTRLLATWWPVLVASAVAVLGSWIGGRLWLRDHRRRLLSRDARLIRIRVPATVSVDAAPALWAHLHALLRPARRSLLTVTPHVVYEYSFTRHGAELGVWVPGVVPPGLVEAAIESAWPGARTVVLQPPPTAIPLAPAVSVGGRLRLARQEALPLRSKFAVDPLRALFGAGAELKGSECAAVQVLARPATGRRARRFRQQPSRLRHGASAPAAAGTRTLRSMIFDIVTPGASSRPSSVRADPLGEAELNSAVAKHLGAFWEVRIRYGASSTHERDMVRLNALASSLAASFGIYVDRNSWAPGRLARPARTMAARYFERGDLLNVAELAACAHVPWDTFARGIVRAGARAVAPPPQVAAAARRGTKLLGVSDTGADRLVGLKVHDGRYHVHVLGSTGSGKSTLMSHMILDDVATGRGVVVIDPKGDLVADVLDRFPLSAARRTHLIDPGASGPHPSLNILAAGDPELAVDNLVGIFRRIYAASWGPRTDDVLRSSCLTLLAATRAPTLADVSMLLTSQVFRGRVLERLSPDVHPLLHGFWHGFNTLPEAARSAVTAPLLNKLRAFLLRDFIRQVIAQPTSTVDLGEVLDGGILLVRLPRGALGDETARLLGSFIVAATWQAALARTRVGESARTDCALYIDEAHNFLTMPYPLEDMLAEARGYRLSMVLAHQNLAQMPTELREGISANARNKIFFACSPEDARALATHMAPNLSEHDLAHLDGFHAAVRLAVDGAPTPAFTMRTRPLPEAIPGRADLIRAISSAMTEDRRAAFAPDGGPATGPDAATKEDDQ